MGGFFIRFAGMLAVLFILDISIYGQQWIVQPWTGLVADLSAWLIKPFDSEVVTSGRIIRSTRNGFAVIIVPGCNGVEAMLVLISAIVAFPSTWKHRFKGIALGCLAIQVINIARIISLFYLGQWNMDVFEFAHLYFWQIMVMLDVLVVWLIWIRTLPGLRPRHAY